MSGYEVDEPIQNSPFEEPQKHWYLAEGHAAELRRGRRHAMYCYRDPNAAAPAGETGNAGIPVDLTLVNLIRERVKAWRDAGYPGVTRTTLELLQWWRREGRQRRLFFAQLEAAETIIFLIEARPDFLQGLDIPADEPSDDKKAEGYAGFRRYACKMATGAGKTTVMAMLIAWSILNKVNDKSDGRFADAVLVVCPNVTIRSRLQELYPERQEASIYVTSEIVPPHLLPVLRHGHVLVTNWHVFEPQSTQGGAKVVKAGRPVTARETITIGPKTTVARGNRYLSLNDYERQVAAGMITVNAEIRDKQGHLKKVSVDSTRYIESDTGLVQRVLGRDLGNKQNILVLNDEAHHAYRIPQVRADDQDEDEKEETEEFVKEATVWVEGIDRVQKLRGVNCCVDLSATPYFLARKGPDGNRPFPWVVSDFGLVEAIESGLVKIPQMAVRDTTGAELPGYFNIWQWIIGKKLTPQERGGKLGSPKPEAVLKYAHHPVAILGGLWETERERWARDGDEPRQPVFILVCKNTKLAKIAFEWLAEDTSPTGIPPAHIAGFRNTPRSVYTIRVDSKVIHETDSDNAKSAESRWMRFTLDSVGKLQWPSDSQGRPIYPEGFEELANKLKRPLHPAGRDIRCIVSVGMLTEGWDCNTVTHIIGLRPFMSQLLCEQVVGRGLRRASYELGDNGRFSEEVAKIFGVPFEVIPMKTSTGVGTPREKRHHVHAVPEKVRFEITFPRVEGYTQAIRNRISANWTDAPTVTIDPTSIAPEVEMKALLPTNLGRPSLTGPGRIDDATLKEFRAKRRLQELVFELARTLIKEYVGQPRCEAPAHVLFPQLVPLVQRYMREKVKVLAPADIKDLFLAPYYGWVVEGLLGSIAPDTSMGEAAEVPRYEANREPGTTGDVSFWTSKEVREVVRSHLNYMVADTKVWEQSAAYSIDRHSSVEAFVKNAGLGFAMPYLHNGQAHDYVPDFILRLVDGRHLVLETKGYDPLEGIKRDAAERWVKAVNADGTFGRWLYALVKHPQDIEALLTRETNVAIISEGDAEPKILVRQ